MNPEGDSHVNRIDALFREKKRLGKKSLVIYLTAGFPSMNATKRLIKVLEASGTDLLELGVPFSDPIADGPTIQRSSAHALRQGTTLAAILDLVHTLRSSISLPIVLFSAYNPFVCYGLERLVRDAEKAGVDGFLAPDLPPEEAVVFRRLCRERNLKLVFLIAPTTPPARKELIARESSGFIYYISSKGVTGVRSRLSADLASQVRQIKQHSDKPVAVGFGVSKPEHVRMIAGVADAVVVGSALIDLVARNAHSRSLEKIVARFVRDLKKPIA
jgi:tryptophan synthase alpha chain